uniref:Uncharacterized protein n=1 Tax=Anguilla anguilla TaxID=7936 RepID=A0A0E9WXZ1_ANGAN
MFTLHVCLRMHIIHGYTAQISKGPLSNTKKLYLLIFTRLDILISIHFSISVLQRDANLQAIMPQVSRNVFLYSYLHFYIFHSACYQMLCSTNIQLLPSSLSRIRQLNPNNKFNSTEKSSPFIQHIVFFFSFFK